ncbi:MAG: ABC transporter permease [Planctomycetes bacterium]|nr:ABC transporter permease [Planctomycetota bacterium]
MSTTSAHKNPPGRFSLFLRRRTDVLLVYGILFAIIIVAALLDGHFLSRRNIINLFVTSLPLLIASYAQTVAILSGGVDLSIGALISFVTTICATQMAVKSPYGYIPGIALALAAGAASGLLNGTLVTRFKLQPLIVTLATSLMLGGMALFMLDKPGGQLHRGFARLVTRNWFSFCIFVVITALLWLLLNRTRFGKAVYAVGGNAQSAYAVGINPVRTKTMAFVLVGLLTAAAGIIMACQMYSGDPNAGAPMTLRTMTAAVIGGTSFSGGKGRIECTIAGVFILAIINNILNLIGLSAFYQYVAQGLILIFAIAVTSRGSGRVG